MIVQCPSCASRYRIRDANIPPSGGKIRCPSCSHSFIVYPESADDEDRTSVQSGQDINRLVRNTLTGLEKAEEGRDFPAEQEDNLETEMVTGDDLDKMRAMQALEDELGDPMEQDGTVEMQNPMQIWMDAQRKKGGKGGPPPGQGGPQKGQPGAGDDYDMAATEIVDPDNVDIPGAQGPPNQGPPNQGPPNQGPPNQGGGPSQKGPGQGGGPKLPPLPNQRGPQHQQQQQQSRQRQEEPVRSPAGSGSFPQSGPVGQSSGPPQQPSGPPQQPQQQQQQQQQQQPPPPSSPGLTDDIFDQTLDEEPPGSSQPLSSTEGADAGSGGIDPTHDGPWKLKTNFGLTYEFPDTKSLKGWLSSREDLDGYTLSADDGDSFHPLHTCPQIEDASARSSQSIASSGLNRSPSPADVSRQDQQQQQQRQQQPSQPPSGLEAPVGPGPPQQPFSTGPGESTSQPGPRVSNEFRPPSRSSHWDKVLWLMFVLLLLVAVGVAVQTFEIYDIVGTFKRDVLGQQPQQTKPIETSTDPEAAPKAENIKQLTGSEEDHQKQVERLLEDARNEMENNRLQSALDKLETVEALNPDNVALHELKANAYERLGQADKAKAAEEKASDLRAKKSGGEAAKSDAGQAPEQP